MDQWNEKLLCAQCKMTGTAILCQSDYAEKPSVEFVSAGFMAVHTDYGPNFYCVACEVPVAP